MQNNSIFLYHHYHLARRKHSNDDIKYDIYEEECYTWHHTQQMTKK